MAIRPTLPQLLRTAVWAEIVLFIVYLAVPSAMVDERDGSTFGYFWFGLGLLLFPLWIAGWIAVLRHWRRAFELYAAGWVAAVLYSFLSGPSAYSQMEGLLGDLMALAGNAVLLLSWLRKRGMGDWAEEEKVPRLPVVSPPVE